jgi:hypothetical protein
VKIEFESDLTQKYLLEILSNIHLNVNPLGFNGDCLGESYDCNVVLKDDDPKGKSKIFQFQIANNSYTVVSTISEEDPTISRVQRAGKERSVSCCRTTTSRWPIPPVSSDTQNFVMLKTLLLLCNTIFQTNLPPPLESKIDVLTHRCFGKTKSGKHCENRRRQLTEGNCWCHWHVDQIELYRVFKEGNHLSPDALRGIPDWWKQETH